MDTLIEPTGTLSRLHWKAITGGGRGWVPLLPVVAWLALTLWLVPGSFFFESGNLLFAELFAPLAGAFLVAQSMALEYQDGGAVLLAAAAGFRNLVRARILVSLAIPLALTALSLLPGSADSPSSLALPALAAGLPSLLFLTAASLWFSSAWRSARLGFLTAACLWILDLAFGYTGNPLFSLHGAYAVAVRVEPLQAFWLAGKAALVATALALFWVHDRCLFALCRPRPRARAAQVAVGLTALAVAYVLSGAALWVAYGYFNRARLARGPGAWLQERVQAYGPVPIAALFGPAFRAYTELPRPGGAGDPDPATSARLEEILDRWPHSIWADAVAFDLASARLRSGSSDGIRACLEYPVQYPRSPCAPAALKKVLDLPSRECDPETRLTAARRLAGDYPRSPEAQAAASVLLQAYPYPVHPEEVFRAARDAAQYGPIASRPHWLAVAARISLEMGQGSEAKLLARQARTLGLRLLRSAPAGEPGPFRGEVERGVAEAEALLSSPDPVPRPLE